MLRTKMLSKLLSISSRATVTGWNGISRNLYSPAALGMEGFLSARERTKMQISNIDTFKSKMNEFVKDENSKNLVFTEDLKNMLHITDKADVELLTQMIKKFCSQSQETRFGSFVFGPPIMRLFHHLNDSKTALELYKDPNLEGFFDQLISYQLILDMLFNNKMYQEVLDTFDVTRARQIQGGRFPKHAVVLALGACYKLNTPAALEYASKLWKDATGAGHIPMRRAATFFATLALNQGQPEITLEVLSSIRRQNYATVKTIKALAQASLKRYDDAVDILKSVLEVDNPMATKQTFPSSVIEQLKGEFTKNTNKDLQSDFEKVVGFLSKHGHLSDKHLDEILCAEIQETAQMPGNDNYRRSDRYSYDNRRDDGYNRRDDGYRRNDYNRSGNNQRRSNNPDRMQRPGLHELN